MNLNSSAALVAVILVFVHLGIVAFLLAWLWLQSPKTRVRPQVPLQPTAHIKRKDAKHE